jgi:hypothetical protein
MDSTKETLKHIDTVNRILDNVLIELLKRGRNHDSSKLSTPEKEIFDDYTEKLKDCTYGSEEYKDYLKAMKPALDHHYAKNRHHPEHHVGGIAGMNLIDLLEMICDWKAATLRHDDGCIMKSIQINQARFGYSDELKNILWNTVRCLEP